MDPADLAIAAVRKWLAEWDRCVRIDRRYADRPKFHKRIEAQRRTREAYIDAVAALQALPENLVEIDGVFYEAIMTDDAWSISESSVEGTSFLVVDRKGGSP